MRNLMIIIMMAFLASPAFADPTSCRMEGPHNCTEQNEDQLMNITRHTIHQIQMEHPGHAFRTQNDDVLDMATRQQAENVKAQHDEPSPVSGFLASLAFWRD